MRALAALLALLAGTACAEPAREQLLREAASTVYVDTEAHTGSGVVVAHVAGATLVLTCRHVVEAANPKAGLAQDITVRGFWGGEHLPAAVEVADADSDLALLYVLRPCDLPAAPVAPRDPRAFDPVDVLGFPAGYQSVTSGRITWQRWLETGVSGAVIAHGASGGPAFDRSGAVVGVVVKLETDTAETEIHGLGRLVSRRAIVKLAGPYLVPPMREVP